MKTNSYNKFWQRIHKSAKEKGSPLRVMFELTYRCNFFCRHCYVPLGYRKYKELNTKEVFFILDQLRDIGCFYLGFTGGEPFVREDIFDILWYAKRCGFEIIIYTNGSLVDEKIASELAHLVPNKVDITIPAMTDTAFDRITGVSGYRNRVFKAIELLHKKGVSLGFKSCLLKENNSQMQEIKDFARSLGALHRLDSMLCLRLDGSKEPYKYKISSFSEEPDMDKCDLPGIEYQSENKTRENFLLFYCGVGRSQAAITPLGELKMCLMIDYPKYRILETSFEHCWHRLKKLVNNIKKDENYKCDTCELRVFCKWCPAKSWLEYGNFTSCELRTRNKALEIAKRYKREKQVDYDEPSLIES